MSKAECWLFAGPTFYRSDGPPLPVPPGVRLLPPVQREDVAALCAAEPPGVMILVDGLFHDCLAVGHVEIREAVQAGWRVWGLSSMGAIRAYEMRHLGVRGYGQVYALFTQEEDFQDDEVALLHELEPPYGPLTEPMVHLRSALDHLQAVGHLSPEARSRIETHLKSLWYGERTLRLFADLLRSTAPSLESSRLDSLFSQFDRFRIKTQDLEQFLREQVWRHRPDIYGSH